jgi:hypothetical protein
MKKELVEFILIDRSMCLIVLFEILLALYTLDGRNVYALSRPVAQLHDLPKKKGAQP